jgi:cell division septal protein FtsQ|tara:strand:+ start:163 stop:819 length:657 start_codon:yes stop_codon:yes gene_type:complete
MKKRLIIAFALLLLFSTYKPQKLNLTNKLKIKKIKIENNFLLEDQLIKKDLNSLYDTNLFLLRNTIIEDSLKKNDFIKGFEVKKIYPDILKIKIYEKKPIAILQNKKKKFYIDENLTLINYIDLNLLRDLPIVFGDKDNFKILYKKLKEINFPLYLVEKFYWYESKRWDIEIYQNKIIKLPVDNYNQSLIHFIALIKQNNFDEFEIFDYRIKNQIILK